GYARCAKINRRTQTLKGFNVVNNLVLPQGYAGCTKINRRTQTLKGFNAVNNPVLRVTRSIT
ncbi:MAG: hypothetical protein LBV16_03755, partial [Elusimicrobiota bacterium]|nr:hypothetical protein [Elusimicrobiota bacterium]